MSKKDLFVVIYCTIWASLITIFVFMNMFRGWFKISDIVFLCNFAFLGTTSLLVFIKPVRRFVDKHIIEKLP